MRFIISRDHFDYHHGTKSQNDFKIQRALFLMYTKRFECVVHNDLFVQIVLIAHYTSACSK